MSRRKIKGYDHALDSPVEISPKDLKARCAKVQAEGGRVARIGGDLTLFVRNKAGDQERLAEYYDRDVPTQEITT